MISESTLLDIWSQIALAPVPATLITIRCYYDRFAMGTDSGLSFDCLSVPDRRQINCACAVARTGGPGGGARWPREANVEGAIIGSARNWLTWGCHGVGEVRHGFQIDGRKKGDWVEGERESERGKKTRIYCHSLKMTKGYLVLEYIAKTTFLVIFAQI